MDSRCLMAPELPPWALRHRYHKSATGAQVICRCPPCLAACAAQPASCHCHCRCRMRHAAAAASATPAATARVRSGLQGAGLPGSEALLLPTSLPTYLRFAAPRWQGCRPTPAAASAADPPRHRQKGCSQAPPFPGWPALGWRVLSGVLPASGRGLGGAAASTLPPFPPLAGARSPRQPALAVALQHRAAGGRADPRGSNAVVEARLLRGAARWPGCRPTAGSPAPPPAAAAAAPPAAATGGPPRRRGRRSAPATASPARPAVRVLATGVGQTGAATLGCCSRNREADAAGAAARRGRRSGEPAPPPPSGERCESAPGGGAGLAATRNVGPLCCHCQNCSGESTARLAAEEALLTQPRRRRCRKRWRP